MKNFINKKSVLNVREDMQDNPYIQEAYQSSTCMEDIEVLLDVFGMLL